MFSFDDIQENIRQVGEFTLRRQDPFGFWIITRARGKLPKELEGRFTDTYHALNRLKNYEHQKAK